MALILNPGVNPAKVKPEVLLALMVVDGIYAGYDVHTVITSISDGEHGRYSLHAFGYAVDIRTNHLPADVDKDILASQIQRRLGNMYDVVFEPNPEHIHIEYDPR